MTASEAPDRLSSAEPESAAVTRSLRPKPRSAAFEAAHKPVRTAQPKPKPRVQADTARPAKPKPGNATRAATAGATSGRETGTATARGGGGKKKATGNAAASNYPGQVKRKVFSRSTPRVRKSGSVRIRFIIGSNGSLTSLSVLKSSGIAEVDRAALNHFRRLGRFPKPPPGARRGV